MKKIVFFVVILACIVTGSGFAASTNAGDWFTRLRALYVLPNDHSGTVHPIPHSGVSVNPCWTAEFDFGYMFTKYLGIGLILSTCKNTIHGTKSLSGTKIANTWLLPPCLNLHFRPFPNSSIVQPYIGAGVNYTLFYNSHCKLAGTSIHLDHSWGPDVQLGCDFFFNNHWFVNADVKYIWISTEAHLYGTTKAHVNVTINPWLMGLGIGRKW